MTDEEFFTVYPDRNYRIRKPIKQITIDKQRAAHFAEEFEAEFQSLGPHKRDRRRIIIYRIPRDSPWFDPAKQLLMPVPMLAFADETIEDNDATLAPIFHGIMEDARARYARMR